MLDVFHGGSYGDCQERSTQYIRKHAAKIHVLTAPSNLYLAHGHLLAEA